MSHGTNEPAFDSRYCAASPCASPDSPEERFIEDLEAVGSVLSHRAVLFVTSEAHVDAVSRHKTRLEETFIVPVIPWDRMRTLGDKEQQMRLAQKAGVDTPITTFIHGPDDVAAAAAAVPFPAVLKPSLQHAMYWRTGLKAALVDDPDRLRQAYERFSDVGPMLLQELMPGGNGISASPEPTATRSRVAWRCSRVASFDSIPGSSASRVWVKADGATTSPT